MRQVLCLILPLLMISAPAAADPVVQVSVSGWFDSGIFSVNDPWPDGVGIGTYYTATLSYDTAVAGPDIDPLNPESFMAALDAYATEFVVEAAGMTWTLDGQDVAPYYSRVIQSTFRTESFEVDIEAPSEAQHFPGTAGGIDKIRCWIAVDPETGQYLWTDPEAAVNGHLSDQSQINDSASAATTYFVLASRSDDGRWELRDENPRVTVSVLFGVIANEESSWSRIKSLYGPLPGLR